MLHTTCRADRWAEIGLINDPDSVAADKPDKYGLMVDRAKDGTLTWDPEVFGFSSGVVGLQLFTNKKFDAKKWSVQEYLAEPAVPWSRRTWSGWPAPCATSAFNPNRPPKDPAEPKWENLDSHIGSQYFREGMLVGGLGTPTNDFLFQYLSIKIRVPARPRAFQPTSSTALS